MDWQWLCRRCHMIADNRMNNLLQNSPYEKRSSAIKKMWSKIPKEQRFERNINSISFLLGREHGYLS